jgi:protein-L-isoaspartate(D-aspartate) O-methyltransferase
MSGWIIPPPKETSKSKDEFERERIAKVNSLIRDGLLQSERIEEALLKVRREDFIPRSYRDYAYLEVPLPLPGEIATISCPHSYPLFYEPLALDMGHRFLEIGTGSGYGAAIAREVVGSEGLVVSIEIDPVTYEFAKRNIEVAGYEDIVLLCGDGGFGYPQKSPYDRIAITATCRRIPTQLIEQLDTGGRLISPIDKTSVQELVLLEKDEKGTRRQRICEVLYVPLRGSYCE